MPLLWTVWHIIAMSSNVDWCMIYVKTRSTGTCSSSSRGRYSCSELLSIQSRAQFCVSLVNSNVIVHTTTHVFILCSSCKLLSSILCHSWLLLVLSIDKAECCRCDCWPKWQALKWELELFTKQWSSIVCGSVLDLRHLVAPVPVPFWVACLGKLFTHICLWCYAVWFGTSQSDALCLGSKCRYCSFHL